MCFAAASGLLDTLVVCSLPRSPSIKCHESFLSTPCLCSCYHARTSSKGCGAMKGSRMQGHVLPRGSSLAYVY